MTSQYRKKPTRVEAIRIAESTDQPNDETLDPNTLTLAHAAGWMLTHGFGDFHVDGDKAPFGIALRPIPHGGMLLARPGDWIVRDPDGSFRPCSPEVFAANYDPAPTDDEVSS